LRAASFVPGNSLAFVAGQNLEIWWQEFREKLDELAQNPDLDTWLQENLNIEGIEQDWGIDFEEDVFSWMTGEIAGAALPYWGEGPLGGPAVLLLLEMGNQTLAEAKMAGIVNAMLDELHESGLAADTYATEIGGLPATMMRWEDSPGSGLKTKQGHLFLDDFLVVGSSEQALGAAVNAYQNSASSLAQSAEFPRMLSNLPTDKTGLLDVNGSQATDFVLATIVTDMAGKEVYHEKLAALVEPVQSAGFSYRIVEEDSTAALAFHVKAVEVPVMAVWIDAPDFVGEGYDFMARVDVCQVQSLGAAQYDVNCEPAFPQLTDVTGGRVDGTDIPVAGWTEPTPGTVSLAQIMLGSGVSGRGYLAALHFHLVPSLPSGSYRLQAAASGYISEYYDNVYSREEASPILVTSPENTTCIDFTLMQYWDVSKDGCVNVLDIILVGQQFGETGAPRWVREDVNCDAVISVLDIILIGQHFGELCAS
jgi:hypothetical protein